MLVLILLLPLLGVSGLEPRLPSSATAAPLQSPLPDVAAAAWQSRGQLIRQEPYEDPPLDDRDRVLGAAWRATYASVSGVDGGAREVSAAFFVPRGDPPDGGWPVISLAHGTTGIGIGCGPAQDPDLRGYSPVIESLLAGRYAVAFSDYEGLGESGTHPYLEPRSAAFNIVDAVRAMRALSPTVSARWVALGYSQGGQAVWAANELNPFYGEGLELLGSVALAPAANVTGVADLAWSNSMTEEQRALFPLIIVGLSRYTPGFDTDAYLHGEAEAAAPRLARCGITADPSPSPKPAPGLWQRLIDLLRGADEMRPATHRDAVALRDALRRTALPQQPLSEPMLVVTGRRDATVLSNWVRSSVSDSCALGGQIQYVELPDADHREILWKPSRTVMRWITDRFAGNPAASDCPAARG